MVLSMHLAVKISESYLIKCFDLKKKNSGLSISWFGTLLVALAGSPTF